MQILLAAAVLSVMALLWACWAIARHIRKASEMGVEDMHLAMENIFAAQSNVSKIAHTPRAAAVRKQSQPKPWSTTSNDLGDLSDPYQRPRALQRRPAH